MVQWLKPSVWVQVIRIYIKTDVPPRGYSHGSSDVVCEDNTSHLSSKFDLLMVSPTTFDF